MALTYSEPPELGAPAPSFSLRGVDGKVHSLSDFSGQKGLIVIFMCNHCPYVIAVQDRINDLAKKFAPLGIPLVGINSNDPVNYPDDSFEKMREVAKKQRYVFPYLIDETQEVAQAYRAVCTPDPYLYAWENGKFVLRYHGRIDDNWKEPSKIQVRDLADAAQAILDGRPIVGKQTPSMGCSIKWK